VYFINLHTLQTEENVVRRTEQIQTPLDRSVQGGGDGQGMYYARELTAIHRGFGKKSRRIKTNRKTYK
jgi:hypothetical protein